MISHDATDRHICGRLWTIAQGIQHKQGSVANESCPAGGEAPSRLGGYSKAIEKSLMNVAKPTIGEHTNDLSGAGGSPQMIHDGIDPG